MQDFRTLTASQQCQLEKRYGSIKEVFRKRADGLGQSLSVGSPAIREVSDIDRIRSHFDRYSGTEVGLAVSDIRSLVSLYRVRANSGWRDAHIVWTFGGTEHVVGCRDREFFEDIEAIRNDEDISFKRIPYRVFSSLYMNPGLLAKVNGVLLNAYIGALEFHDWRFTPHGLVVAGSGAVAMAHPRDTMKTGSSDRLGIEIGMGLVEDIILNGGNADMRSLADAVMPLLVHEMVHLQLDVVGEPHAYAIEMMLINKEGDSMRGFIYDSLRYCSSNLQRSGTGLDPRDYYAQVYKGVVIALEELSKYNGEIAAQFKKDRTRHKTAAARRSISLIRDEDTQQVLSSGFVGNILSLRNEQIDERLRDAEILRR